MNNNKKLLFTDLHTKIHSIEVKKKQTKNTYNRLINNYPTLIKSYVHNTRCYNNIIYTKKSDLRLWISHTRLAIQVSVNIALTVFDVVESFKWTVVYLCKTKNKTDSCNNRITHSDRNLFETSWHRSGHLYNVFHSTIDYINNRRARQHTHKFNKKIQSNEHERTCDEKHEHPVESYYKRIVDDFVNEICFDLWFGIMYYSFRLFCSRYICPVLNNMSVTNTLYVPQCIQQVFSLELFGLVFQQSYASLDINTGSLDKRAVRVHVVIKDDQADQYAQHEKMSFLFSKLNGTVKHNKTRVIVLLHSTRMRCPMMLGKTIITLRNFDYLIAEKVKTWLWTKQMNTHANTTHTGVIRPKIN